MPKKTRNKTRPARFELNDGDLIVEVDHRGAVYSVEPEGGDWNEDKQGHDDLLMLELSATELDAIVKNAAEVKRLAEQLNQAINNSSLRQNTRQNGYVIAFCGEDNCDEPDWDWFDGSINIGCQCIQPEDVKRVHAASLKARGRKA